MSRRSATARRSGSWFGLGPRLMLGLMLGLGGSLAAAQEESQDSLDLLRSAYVLLTQSPPEEVSESFEHAVLVYSQTVARCATDSATDPQTKFDLVAYGNEILFHPRALEGSRECLDQWLVPALRSVSAGTQYELDLCFNLASLFLVRREFGTAREELAVAQDRWPQAPCFPILEAELHCVTEQWALCRACCDRAEDLLASLDPETAEADRVLLTKVLVLLDARLGRTDRALRALERELHQEPPLPTSEAGALEILRADLLLQAGNISAVLAIEDARIEALELDHRPQLRLRRAIAQGVAARVGRGEVDSAIVSLETALDAVGVDSTGRFVGDLLLAELELERDPPRIREAALRVQRAEVVLTDWSTQDEGREALRERPYLDIARLHLAQAEGTTDLRDHEDSLLESTESFLADWASTPLLEGGIGFLEGDDRRRELIHDAVDIVGRREGDVAAFELWARVQCEGSLARRLQCSPPTWEELRAGLLTDSRTIVLGWFPSQRGTLAFALRGDRLERKSLPPWRDLRALLREDPPRAARELVRWTSLFEGCDTVLWLGDEWLPPSQVASLPVDGEFAFAQTHALCRLPSLPVGLWLANRPSPAVEPRFDLTILLGAPESLDGERFHVELDALLAPFARARTLELRSLIEDPGKLGAEGTNSAMVEFLAHSVLDEDRDRSVGILGGSDRSSEPSVLWADALEKLDLSPLVVLAHCGSGEGPKRAGEDSATHLGGAAMLGGARCVLLGEGRLDADWIGKVLAEFHTALAAGHTPAESLRLAHRHWGMHPDCALRLEGLGDQPFCTSPSPRSPGGRWRVLLGVLLALGGLGLWRGSRASPRERRAGR